MLQQGLSPDNSLEDLQSEDTKIISNIKLGAIGIDDIKNEVETLINVINKNHYSQNLQIILETQERLKERKANEIRFSDPILKQDTAS